MGHFARNCPRKRRQANINLLDFNDNDEIMTKPIAPVRDKVCNQPGVLNAPVSIGTSPNEFCSFVLPPLVPCMISIGAASCSLAQASSLQYRCPLSCSLFCIGEALSFLFASLALYVVVVDSWGYVSQLKILGDLMPNSVV